MNIIVVGCGKIGTTVLENLVEEGHNVTAVDVCPAALTDITNIHDVITVCGNGGDCETLEEAGAADADLVVATTSSDEVNMLCCYMAKCMGVANTVARIRNPEYNDRSLATMKQHLGLSLSINPDKLAAHELYNILRLPAAVKIETFSTRKFEMIELKLKGDSPLTGTPLSEARNRLNAKFLICVVQRGDQVFIPDGHFVLQGGDVIGLTAVHSESQKMLKASGIAKKQGHQHHHCRRQQHQNQAVDDGRFGFAGAKRQQQRHQPAQRNRVEQAVLFQIAGIHADGTHPINIEGAGIRPGRHCAKQRHQSGQKQRNGKENQNDNAPPFPDGVGYSGHKQPSCCWVVVRWYRAFIVAYQNAWMQHIQLSAQKVAQ